MKSLFTFLLLLLFAQSFAQTEIDSISEPDINSFVEVDQEPMPMNMDEFRKSFTYPEELDGVDYYGMIAFRILIDTSGNYVQHQVIRRAHPLLEKEIVKHLHTLKFTPAMKDNQKIMFWVNIPFRICPLRD